MDGTYIYGMKLHVSDPDAVAEWLCENLFFSREPDSLRTVLRSGGFRLILEREGGEDQMALTECDPDAMCLGFRHIALETYDIGRAITYCQSKGMKLQLNGRGGARYSGKVYGTGMDYFNILTDFGFPIEVSQKLHQKPEQTENLIEGLEHVGVQVEDACEAVEFYERLGFKKEFEPVMNRTGDQTVICCMVSAGGTVVELYEFEDAKVGKRQSPAVMDTMVIAGGENPRGKITVATGTAGERLEIWG